MDPQHITYFILCKGILTSKSSLRLWYKWHDCNDITLTVRNVGWGGREREIKREALTRRKGKIKWEKIRIREFKWREIKLKINGKW